jgi:hypothetical protein
MNAILEDPTETDYAEREAYSSTDQEAFDTDLRDFEEMIENEGWMYLYELGFSTWEEYEQHGLRDEDEERVEVEQTELNDQDDHEAWERWMEREAEEEHEFVRETLWNIPIDVFDPYGNQEQQDHEQELDQAERNADRELDIYVEEDEAERIQQEEDAEWDRWVESNEAGFSTWEEYLQHSLHDEDEERMDHLNTLEAQEEQEERNADREANYEPEDDREWVLNVYGLRLHHWSYEPCDPDADEYFELLYRYNCLLGFA